MFALRRSTPATRTFSTSARASLAKMNIIGRLAASPEVTATSTGREITKYSLASNSGPKDREKTSWYNIVTFVEDGPRREFLTSLEKGTLLYVECDAMMKTYEDKETGKRSSSLNLVQRQFEVLSRPNRAQEGEQ